MKNIIVTAFTLLAIGMFFSINTTFAGDVAKVYEMAESGITIEFNMMPEEITAGDAETSRQVTLREAHDNNPEKRVKVFEMGESGQSVVFPMTAEEIAAEDAENEGLAAVRKAKSEEPPKHIVIYEFAESGITVEFPLETPEEAVPDVVAEKNPQKIQKFN